VHAVPTGQVADGAEVLVVATPYGAAAEALREAGDLDGKTVIDITNPLTDDMSGLTVGFDSSAAEEIQEAVPGARVVKAFNTVFAQVLGDEGAAQNVQVFYAGDDDGAKQTVRTLIEGAGFEAVDAGPLSNARYLEPMGMFNIYLGCVAGRGTSMAPRWVTVER
jgi:8-hydroxy-5-deazaflavin:NADPH oxidoreductase